VVGVLKEQFINSRGDFVKLCAHLSAFVRLGFDTEFIGENTFHPRLCLLQVATEEGLYIIDPLGVGTLDPFWQVLADPRREVVVHGGREDARLCYRLSNRCIGRLFDLQIAAGFLGYGYPVSQTNLLRELLGVTLSKAEQVSDWGRRPLSSRQIRYAYDDVRYLLTAQQQLRQRLEDLGRLAWVEEEFQRLAGFAQEENQTETERWRKLRGVGNLSRRQLATLRELYHWRAGAASRLNRPPKAVCRDDLLLQIARRGPRSEADLKMIRGLPHEHYGAILEAVEKARDLPAEALPELPTRGVKRPEVDLLVGVLTAVVHEVASRLQIAPQLVATNADLRSLIRGQVFGEPVRPTLLDVGWRREHIRGLLLDVLTGKAALRFRGEVTRHKGRLDILAGESLRIPPEPVKSSPPEANS
jgi:ribonuclease D